MIARLLALLDTAVDTVINAAVDRIVAAWIEAGPPGSLWEPYKGRRAVRRTESNVDTGGQVHCRVEQTFDLGYRNRRSTGKIEGPRRARTRRGRVTFSRQARKATTP